MEEVFYTLVNSMEVVMKRFSFVLVGMLLLVLVRMASAAPQSPVEHFAVNALSTDVHTGCENYREAPVGLFVGTACSPDEPWWPVSAAWETTLQGSEIDNKVSSVYVESGWSVKVAENPDGSGRFSCLS